MRGWLQEIGCGLEEQVDRLRHRLRTRAGAYSRLQVLPYRGFGNERQVHVKGRVLLAQKSPPSGSSLQNILATYRRFYSQEVPGQKVAVRFQSSEVTVTSDSEGYLEAVIPISDVAPGFFHQAEFKINGNQSTGLVILPPSTAEFGVISDIDDTVLVSHATSYPRMVYTLLARNARARVTFPGTPEFYNALHQGKNPFFYVSSSPWNLYDLLVDFLDLREFPKGPLFLQDYGLERDRFLCSSHRSHKIQQIELVLQSYPALPFILIGDSGQHDPEIYAEVLERTPNRIKAVYIRDVTDALRDEEIHRLTSNLRQKGGELLLVSDIAMAADHARQRGFIP